MNKLIRTSVCFTAFFFSFVLCAVLYTYTIWVLMVIDRRLRKIIHYEECIMVIPVQPFYDAHNR